MDQSLPLPSTCRALPSFSDCILQGVGNRLPLENRQRFALLCIELSSPSWLVPGLPALSAGQDHSDCCLLRASWKEVPDLPCPKHGQATLAGTLPRAVSLPTSCSYTTTIWRSHTHPSTLTNTLVVDAHLRFQRNLLEVSNTESWALDIKAY